MKKTLLAAALLAGFAGAAHAQTSVTLYGIIDVGLGYNKVKVPRDVQANFGSRSRIGMIDGRQSGSRWGLRGSEDLGDGLRATFQIENGFDLRNGEMGPTSQNGRLFGRHATLGLASDSWGQLDFGRQTNVASKYFGSIDPFAQGFSHAALGHAISSSNTRRLDNLVLYQTPNIEGFQLGVGYSFNSDDFTNDQSFKTHDNFRSFTAGVKYQNGPLYIAVAYDQVKSAAATQNAKPKVYAIGATYDLEVVKLAAAYGRTSDGWMNGAGAAGLGAADFTGNRYGTDRFAKGFKADSFMLGVTAPIADGSKILASWQRIKPKNDRLFGAGSDDDTSSVYSLAYTYDFSKRTNLYAHTSYISNYAFNDGVKSTQFGVGLRHSF